MLLSELINTELQKYRIGVVTTWNMPDGRHGLYLGKPEKHFPHPTGPQYPIDLTKREDDPDLTQEEIKAIRRRFNLDNIGDIL